MKICVRFVALLIAFFCINLIYINSSQNRVSAATTYSVTSTSNYSFRIDGAAASNALGYYNYKFADFNNNDEPDLMIAVPGGNSIFIIDDSILATYQNLGTSLDLSLPANYWLKLTGASGTDFFSSGDVKIADLDNDTNPDLIIGAGGTAYGGSSSGSVYVIYNTLLITLPTLPANIATKTAPMSDAGNYNLRFDGDTAFAQMGSFSYDSALIDNDAYPDLIIGSKGSGNNGAANSGSVFIIKYSLYSTKSGALSLTDGNNYSTRIDGANASDSISVTNSLKACDANTDGSQDLLIGTYAATNNGANSGSLYIIYNSVLNSYATQNVRLNSISNYSIRFDGAAAQDYLTYEQTFFCKNLGGDSKNELIVGSFYVDSGGKTNNGALYVIKGELLATMTGNVSLATTTNWNLRIDGASTNDLTTFGDQLLPVVLFADVNNDGADEVLMGARGAGSNAGALYIINNNKIDLSTTNTTLNLLSAYNVKFVGPVAGAYLTYGHDTMNVADYNNDGLKDLSFSAEKAAYDFSASGSIYIAMNDIIGNLGPTPVDITPASGFTQRYDGPSTGELGYGGNVPYDINGDGILDFTFSAPNADHNTRTNSGSLYIIINYPHTLSITPVVATSDAQPVISGSVVAPKSLRNIAGVEYQTDDNAVTGTWTSCTAGDSTYDSLSETFNCAISTPLSEGSHVVYFRSYDTATYHTAQVNYASDNFIVDTVGPTSGSIDINSGDTYTNTVNVSLDLSATDATSGVTQMMICNDSGFSGCSYESYALTKSWNLTAGDGIKTVYVKFKDLAGNESSSSSDTIVLDSTATNPNDIIIDSGNTYTNTVLVSLILDSDDLGSGIDQMIISEDSGFSGASWEAYSTSKILTLSTGDGLKTVYAKFKDIANNESSVVSDSIILDTTAPAKVKITSIGQINNIVEGDSVAYFFTSQKPIFRGTGEIGATVYFEWGTESYTTTVLANGTFELIIDNPYLPKGNSTLTYYQIDLAGNKSAERTITLIIGIENFPENLLRNMGLIQDTTLPVITPTISPTVTPTVSIVPTQLPETGEETIVLVIRKEDGTLLKDTTVTVNGVVYKTDSKGQISVNADVKGLYIIKVRYNNQDYTQELTLTSDKTQGEVTINTKANIDYMNYVYCGGAIIGLLVLFVIIKGYRTNN